MSRHAKCHPCPGTSRASSSELLCRGSKGGGAPYRVAQAASSGLRKHFRYRPELVSNGNDAAKWTGSDISAASPAKLLAQGVNLELALLPRRL